MQILWESLCSCQCADIGCKIFKKQLDLYGALRTLRSFKNRQSSSAVEQRTHKPLVGGPNPLSGTISKPAILLELRASFVESTSTNGRNNVCGGYKKKAANRFGCRSLALSFSIFRLSVCTILSAPKVLLLLPRRRRFRGLSYSGVCRLRSG